MDKVINILLVEDSVTDAYSVKRILQKKLQLPCRIHHAQSIGQAERILRDHNDLELILLDLSLPDIDDERETFQRLEQINGNLPVIILTSLKDYAMAIKVVAEGAVDFVDKASISTHPDTICDVISFNIKRHRATSGNIVKPAS